MKRNLFDNNVGLQIIERAARLQTNSAPLWGSMTSAEMLRHCSVALMATLSKPKETKASSLKQQIARFMMLNFIPAYPKGARAPEVLNMKKNNMVVEDIAAELANYSTQVNTFILHQGPLLVRHPYFGNMNRRQWGIITWMHLDHHLRQFGV